MMKKIISMMFCLVVMMGWTACGNENEDATEKPEIPDVVGEKPNVPEKPGDPDIPVDNPDEVIQIENLQTRLRIVEASYALDEMWRANPKNLILNYSHTHIDMSYTHFGYTDADGQVLLCKVINFPDSAKEWQGEFVYENQSWRTVTEINVQMSGKVRLYTDEQGKKYGTFELTSFEPSGPASAKPILQPGIYVDTYPNNQYMENTRIEFIDQEIVIIDNPGGPEYTYTYKYEIRENEHAIILTDINGLSAEFKLFFRVVDNTTFEIDYLHAQTAEKSGSLIMTFERENNQQPAPEFCRYIYDQKICHEISATKMFIKTKKLNADDLTKALQNTVAGSIKNIYPSLDNVFYIEMASTSKASLLELIDQWSYREDILSVSPVFMNEFGKEGGGYMDEIIVCLKSKDEYPLLQKSADIYNIKDIKPSEYNDIFNHSFIYYLTLTNARPNALQIANELHETGLFEWAEPNFILFLYFGSGNNPANDVKLNIPDHIKTRSFIIKK